MKKRKNELAQAFALWRTTIQPGKIIAFLILAFAFATVVDIVDKGNILWGCFAYSFLLAGLTSDCRTIFYSKMSMSSPKNISFNTRAYPAIFNILLLIGNVIVIVTRIPWLTMGYLSYKECAGYMLCISISNIFFSLMLVLSHKYFGMYFVIAIIFAILVIGIGENNIGYKFFDYFGINYRLSLVLPVISCLISYILVRLISYAIRKVPISETVLKYYTMK